MNKAHLIFTRLPNSFKVHIDNLELLSVQQIKEIQKFVSFRNGLFDFDTYSFVIQKKLEFNEFVTLIESIPISALCEEKTLKSKTKHRIEFGKYKGLFYSDVPDSYLQWLKSSYRGKDRDIIDEELKSRNL